MWIKGSSLYKGGKKHAYGQRIAMWDTADFDAVIQGKTSKI
jgi:hypothetical protein